MSLVRENLTYHGLRSVVMQGQDAGHGRDTRVLRAAPPVTICAFRSLLWLPQQQVLPGEIDNMFQPLPEQHASAMAALIEAKPVQFVIMMITCVM